MDFFGHTISKISTSPEKSNVVAIFHYSLPGSVKELQRSMLSMSTDMDKS